jgi:hypothetical protein
MSPLECRPRRCGASRRRNCKSKNSSLISADPSLALQVALCGGSCAPVRSSPTPGRRTLFSKGTGWCPGCLQLPLHKQQCGHRTAPLQTARFLESVPPKKKSCHDIVNFLKSLEFWISFSQESKKKKKKNRKKTKNSTLCKLSVLKM